MYNKCLGDFKDLEYNDSSDKWGDFTTLWENRRFNSIKIPKVTSLWGLIISDRLRKILTDCSTSRQYFEPPKLTFA